MLLQLGFEWYLAPEPLIQTISSDACSGVGSGVGVDVGAGVTVGVGVIVGIGVGVAVGSGVGVFVGSGVGVKYASSFLVGSALFFEELGLNKAQTKNKVIPIFNHLFQFVYFHIKNNPTGKNTIKRKMIHPVC